MDRGWAPLCCLAVLLPASLAAQARIEAIVPDGAAVTLSRLGADDAEPAEIGAELAPGDLLDAPADGVSIGLTCTGPEGTNTYLVTAPFRVLIDVPTRASCHVNLLSGVTEVIAEAPTETTAGGVTLGSTGTQYAVELRRRGSELLFNCYVYDDVLQVRSRPEVRAVAGQKLVWSGMTAVSVQPNTRADLVRSAETYARFDLAAAHTRGAAVPDTAGALRTLTTLHLEVLANPTDTTRRVALAKEQLRYRVRDRAMYNLRRVDVRDTTQLRRYSIDPSVLSSGRVARIEASRSRAGGGARASVDASGRAVPTTDGDLDLIAAGRIDEAVRNLDARVESGYATSRDEYALAKAWAGRGDVEETRAHVGRALSLHAADGALSPAEIGELGELLDRRE